MNQGVLNCFFYIGALNETIGYSTRIATFMFKASRSTTDADAFELKGGFNSSFPSRQSGQHAPMSGPQSALIVAKFSDVTVKNPANVTLIRDLTMQVTLHYVTLFLAYLLPASNFSSDIHRARMLDFRAIGVRQVVIVARHRPIMARRWWLC
jgi:hypothetical protein